jgi:hypothetical protein
VDEGGLRASLSGRLEHVQRADGIGIKVVEGDGCRAVMAWLGSRVNDGVGLDLGNQVYDSLTVSDVQFVVDESLEIFLEALLIPAGVSLRAEENGALVVINAVDLISELA